MPEVILGVSALISMTAVAKINLFVAFNLERNSDVLMTHPELLLCSSN